MMNMIKTGEEDFREGIWISNVTCYIDFRAPNLPTFYFRVNQMFCIWKNNIKSSFPSWWIWIEMGNRIIKKDFVFQTWHAGVCICVSGTVCLGEVGREKSKTFGIQKGTSKDQSWVLHYFCFIRMTFLLSSGSLELDVTLEVSLLDLWGMQMTSCSCHHQEVEWRRCYGYVSSMPWTPIFIFRHILTLLKARASVSLWVATWKQRSH